MSQVELEQSAATGLLLDPVKGPPVHANDGVAVDMVPLDGVAAWDNGVRTRRSRSATRRIGTCCRVRIGTSVAEGFPVEFNWPPTGDFWEWSVNFNEETAYGAIGVLLKIVSGSGLRGVGGYPVSACSARPSGPRGSPPGAGSSRVGWGSCSAPNRRTLGRSRG